MWTLGLYNVSEILKKQSFYSDNIFLSQFFYKIFSYVPLDNPKKLNSYILESSYSENNIFANFSIKNINLAHDITSRLSVTNKNNLVNFSVFFWSFCELNCLVLVIKILLSVQNLKKSSNFKGFMTLFLIDS